MEIWRIRTNLYKTIIGYSVGARFPRWSVVWKMEPDCGLRLRLDHAWSRSPGPQKTIAPRHLLKMMPLAARFAVSATNRDESSPVVVHLSPMYINTYPDVNDVAFIFSRLAAFRFEIFEFWHRPGSRLIELSSTSARIPYFHFNLIKRGPISAWSFRFSWKYEKLRFLCVFTYFSIFWKHCKDSLLILSTNS